MSGTVMHIGTRSWWDGHVKTLCGLRLAAADRVWLPALSGNTTCPACLSVRGTRT